MFGERQPSPTAETPFVPAGLISTFTDDFFNHYNEQLVEQLADRMMELAVVVNRFCDQRTLGKMMVVNLCVSEANLKEFSIDETQLRLIPDNRQLELRNAQINFVLEFEFELWTTPSVVSDQGRGTITVQGASISLNLLPYNDHGSLRIEFFDTAFVIGDYDVKLDSVNDFGKATEILLNNYKQFVKKELSNILGWRLAKSVEESMNQWLVKGKTFNIENIHCQLNSTLTSEPVFFKNALAMPMDGSCIGVTAASEAYALLPVYLESEGTKHVQLLLSEQTLNQILQSAHNDERLIVGQKITSTIMKTFFPNFEEVFGHSNDLKVIL